MTTATQNKIELDHAGRDCGQPVRVWNVIDPAGNDIGMIQAEYDCKYTGSEAGIWFVEGYDVEMNSAYESTFFRSSDYPTARRALVAAKLFAKNFTKTVDIDSQA